MPICEPFLQVECDKCGEVSDPVHLTMLAGGGWDDRNVKPLLSRQGYRVDGETTICPECAENEAEEKRQAVG